MLPVICKIGPLTIYSYGMMLVVALVVCSFLLSRDARKAGINPGIMTDLVFWVMIAGVLGARLFYVFLQFDFYRNNPLEIVMVQHGGLAWQGGLILGAFTGLWYFRKKHLPLWPTLDLVAPYIALGHGIGRIGCFLNGCCYGREVSWGIFFPVHQAHLHPTQLYATGGLVLIFYILKNYQRFAKISGQVFALYLVLASLQRYINEYFRADHSATYGGHSIFQVISLAILVIGLIIFFVRTNYGKTHTQS